MTFDDLVHSFKIQKDLNRQIWTSENTLHPKIRQALLQIAQKFYETVDIPNKPPIQDIVFTGSLANYNYSRYSDIDLHLVFDFGKDKEVLTQLFLLAKAKWNDTHDITIKGYDVEVYAEDSSVPHTTTGLYSVYHDTWIKVPERVTPVFDIEDIRTKVSYFVGVYDQLLHKFHQKEIDGLDVAVTAFREKLRKFRKAGLQRGGEYSTENLAFKILRRAGYMDKIAALHTAIVDTQLSVQEKYHA